MKLINKFLDWLLFADFAGNLFYERGNNRYLAIKEINQLEKELIIVEADNKNILDFAKFTLAAISVIGTFILSMTVFCTEKVIKSIDPNDTYDYHNMISASVNLYSDILSIVIGIIFVTGNILMLAIKNNNIKIAVLKRIIDERKKK